MRHFTFFGYVRFYFGTETVIYMKKWTNLQKTITKMKLRIAFLKKCIRHNITPPHLNFCSRIANNLYHARSISKFKNLRNRFITGSMKIEICDAHSIIRSSLSEVIELARHIVNTLPNFMCDDFFNFQNRPLRSYYVRERERLDNKFNWLVRKQTLEKIKHIRPVHYYCSETTYSQVSSSRMNFSLNSNAPPTTSIVSSSSLSHPHPPLHSFLTVF